MKETLLLMCGEMVRAVLEDRKTQTRRIIRGITWIANTAKGVESYWRFEGAAGGGEFDPEWVKRGECKCPYGQPGDRIYFKETHYRWGRWRKDGLTKTGRQRWRFKAVPWEGESNGIRFCVNETRAFEPAKKRNKIGWHKRPSIFMPRLAARVWATITDVRVERVQEIRHYDALAEGMSSSESKTPFTKYRELWDRLNAKRGFGWGKNPWAWVLTFKRITP